ncbi:hypothetical protein TNCV_2613411 [Trichonephila clavipes]|nr:hypothetical protein TNCV_2613411 [Trichonephila clavipes]
MAERLLHGRFCSLSRLWSKSKFLRSRPSPHNLWETTRGPRRLSYFTFILKLKQKLIKKVAILTDKFDDDMQKIAEGSAQNNSTLPACENSQGPTSVHSGVKQPSPKYINPSKAAPLFRTLSPTTVSGSARRPVRGTRLKFMPPRVRVPLKTRLGRCALKMSRLKVLLLE